MVEQRQTGTGDQIPKLKKAPTPEPRQVVVILGESVRYDMLNCNKQTGLKTPNLDRIAAEGIRFERGYNCQPVCSPARSSVWNGHLSPYQWRLRQ